MKSGRTANRLSRFSKNICGCAISLMPYTYSLAYGTYQTGAPHMRALFMDFPTDPKVADTRDEYIFGPAFLVAPVTEQGATTRTIYLPAGSDWYNYWTNQRVSGGQTVTVSAPIDTLPLFVRAGSIVPLGEPVLSADEPQAVTSVRVYPGADGDFALFSDDEVTYSYEKGAGSVTTLPLERRLAPLHPRRRSGVEWGQMQPSSISFILEE